MTQFSLFVEPDPVQNPLQVYVDFTDTEKSLPAVRMGHNNIVVQPEYEYLSSEPLFFKVRLNDDRVFLGRFHVRWLASGLNKKGNPGAEPLVYFESGVCRFNPSYVTEWGYLSQPLHTNLMV